MDFDLRAHTVLLAVAGSRAYGLQRPDSDVDVKGVAIPPLSVLTGVWRGFEQADDVEQIAVFHADLDDVERAAADARGLEGSVYALHKFVRLASECNPHMLDLLWCDEASLRRLSPAGRRLREAAPTFLSLRARHSFGGYAMAQLKRIQGHRAWLLDPPEKPPIRADFGLPEHTLIPRNQLDAAQAAIDKQLDRWQLDLDDLGPARAMAVRERVSRILAEQQLGTDAQWTAAARTVGLAENWIEVMRQERAYRSARTHYTQFRAWERSRNPARAALEAAHGYDTKHASHLVRLLRMALEILDEGRVVVWRGDRDADELRAIRDGAWSYDELLAWSEAQQQRLDDVVARNPCGLPEGPDRDGLEQLVQDLLGCERYS